MYISQTTTRSPAPPISNDVAVTCDGEAMADRLISQAEAARAEGRFEVADELLIMAWEAYERIDGLES